MAKLKGLLELMDEALEMDAAKEAVLRLGLKADNTAADRAKALGFDDKSYYHGIDNSFDEFDLTKSLHDNLGKDWGSRAVFVAPDAKLANRWSKLPEEKYFALSNFPAYDKFLTNKFKTKSPQVLPLKIRNNNLFDYKNPEHIKQMQKLLPENISDAKLKGIKKGNWKHIEDDDIQKSIRNNLFDGFHVKENVNDNVTKGIGIFNPVNIRSKFAKFNPKKAGIPLLTGGAGGAFMSTNLLAAPSSDQDLSRFALKKQHEFRQAPSSVLDKAANVYEYGRDEGGLLGDILYSPGARALRHLERGTTPMVKTGRLPAVPTGDALLDLMGILML